MSTPRQRHMYEDSREDASARIFRQQFAQFADVKIDPPSTFGSGAIPILYSFVSVVCLIIFVVCVSGQQLIANTVSAANYDYTYTYIIDALFVLFMLGSNVLIWLLFRHKQ